MVKKHKKILVVFGTRPEAIKMAPLVNTLLSITEFDVKVCVTGQHREMLDQVLHFFKIIPHFDLDLMKANQSLNELSANILRGMDEVLSLFHPHFVLVHGDTTTSSMAALAAFYKGIKVGHVEAGLRTYNKHAPFPEEINRQITGRIADLHFAPTEQAAYNLIKEKCNKDAIFITGNTVIDALLWGIKHINEDRNDIQTIKKFIEEPKKLIVVTGHRRENFGKKFETFCKALLQIASRADTQIIYPVHLNPNVQDVVYEMLGENPNILLLPPLDYEAFIWLLSQAYLIITDSGGVQEEAPSLNIPVLVTRDVTERQEAIEEGTVKLVGTDTEVITEAVITLLENDKAYSKMVSGKNPYGDGTASKQIVQILRTLQ